MLARAVQAGLDRPERYLDDGGHFFKTVPFDFVQ
jgi:hypothetical protein